MWVFWIVAGALGGGAALFIVARAAATSKAAASKAEDPALAVYRRQLGELTALADRGLLGPDEHQAARTEAARRLLSAAETRRPPEHAATRASRTLVVWAAAGAGLVSLALYLALGSPGALDQPYASRLGAWRKADPSTLDPPRIAAVMQTIARDRPRDPQALEYLGRAELAAGDAFAAAQAFRRAIRLAPQRPDLRTELGEALIDDSDGVVTPPARAAFQEALALDPHDASARYFIGRAQIADGQTAAGLQAWRALAADLPVTDTRRLSLLTQIERAASGAPLDAAASPSSGAPTPMASGQMAFIRSMVARQAAELQAHPDDPQGWMRLVRSYGVLGDRAAQQRALQSARRLFVNRPEVIKQIEDEAKAPGAEGPPPGPQPR